MGKSSKYLIPLKSLSEGIHEYEYTLDDAFFGHTDSSEITEGTVAAVLTVHRTGDIFELHFAIQGNIVIPCGRCCFRVGGVSVKSGASGDGRSGFHNFDFIGCWTVFVYFLPHDSPGSRRGGSTGNAAWVSIYCTG